MASGIGCSVCRESQPVLPYTTGCGHTFCYLCLKSAFERNPECPECHGALPQDIHEKAHMPSGTAYGSVGTAPVWLYAGRTNGWWEYDPVTNKKIENGYQFYLGSLSREETAMNQSTALPEKKESDVPSLIDSDSESENELQPKLSNPNVVMNVSILNRTYEINFERMTQTPISSIGATRPIKRSDGSDTSLLAQIKGIGGLHSPRPTGNAPLPAADSSPLVGVINQPLTAQVFIPGDM